MKQIFLIIALLLFAMSAQAETEASPGSPSALDAISTHKINYFVLNREPRDEQAQVKFQLSVKYKLFNYERQAGTGSIAPYFAYSQKSLWNVGRESMPFEESNYNPEFFLTYQVDGRWGDTILRSIVLSPYEHESNGVAGPDSRSWNRRYILLRTGFFPSAAADDGEDRAEFFLKLWHASGCSDQDAYLRAQGSPDRFLDYAGRGEAGIVVRDVLISGGWGNRLNVTTRIFRDRNKSSYNIEYIQKIKRWNVRPYYQYWYGYNETLLRFDRFERRRFLGLSFPY